MVSVLCSHQCFDSGNCVQEGYPGHKIPCDSNPKSFSSGSNGGRGPEGELGD